MSVRIKEALMSQCHEETGGTWARALSPQEVLRIRSAGLICRAEVVLEKGCCEDADLPSLMSRILAPMLVPLLPCDVMCSMFARRLANPPNHLDLRA